MSEPVRTRVFITTDTIGGVWTYSLALAAGFSASGIATTLAVLGPAPSPVHRAAVAQIADCDIVATGLPLDWGLNSKTEMTRLIRALQTEAAASGSDSVHLHSPSLAAIPWSKPVVAVAHSCMASWWMAVHDGVMPPMFDFHAELTAMGLQNASVVIAPSQAFRDMLYEAHGACRPVDVVHNGLAAPEPIAAKRENGLLFAGRLWDEGKNIALLNQLGRVLPNRISVAGPCSSPVGVRAVLPDLHYLGDLPQAALRAAMASCALFISCAFYEPFGLSVLEAAQLGTPLLLSDIPTFRELWSDAAIFVSPNDVGAWVEAVGMLMGNPKRRAQLGRAAQLKSRLYTGDQMVRATIALHREVCPQLLEAA